MSRNPQERSITHHDKASGATGAPADPDNNLGRGAPSDREERIEQLKKGKQRSANRQERKPEDLDRETADIEREGIAGETPGIRPRGDADFIRGKD